MAADGWRPGNHYDAAARTHDGLVPFEALDETDRWTAELATETSAAAEILAHCIEYPRGNERLFRPSELRAGMGVALQDDPSEVGEVQGWDTERGRVTAVRVRWADGEETTHYPEERELARLD